MPQQLGGFTVGVLVQSTFGNSLIINGAPIGRELKKSLLNNNIPYEDDEGSCMIVIATDAPLSNRNLKRVAKRAIIGIGKVGGIASNGSGDYVIAFSTYPDKSIDTLTSSRTSVNNRSMTAIFQAATEATEEAIINSLFMAETITSSIGKSEALPIDETLKILKKYNSLNWNKKLYPWKK